MNKKFKDWVDQRWKDPVWSKVIANCIWYGTPTVIGLVIAGWFLLDLQGIGDRIIEFFNYSISFSIWSALICFSTLILIVWLIKAIGRVLRMKTDQRSVKILNEKIGEYTFQQLYEILDKEKHLERTQKMRDRQIGPPNATVLELFGAYRQTFNSGLKNSTETLIGYRISEEDGGYLIDIIAPRLLSYGLVNKVEEQGFIINHRVMYITYETSQLGYKFFDCWDKLSEIQRGR